MFKRLWKWLTGQAEKEIMKEIEKLDKYEDDLEQLIKSELPPKKTAKRIVDFVQDKLKKAVKNIF